MHSSGSTPAFEDMEMEVWSRVLFSPNTFSSTQANSLIIRYLYLWPRFPCLLRSADTYPRKWTVRLFMSSSGEQLY